MSTPVTGLSIGLLLYSLLSQSTEVPLLGVKTIQPCYNRNAEKGYPFILFNTGSTLNIPVKNNQGMDEVAFTIESCAKTYSQCVEVSEAVRSAIESGKKTKSLELEDGRSITGSQFLLRDVDEFYDLDLDCYVQKLQFSCKAWGEG